MDPSDPAIKCEPTSPLGMGRCTQPSLDDNLCRDYFLDYPAQDDYGSDPSYQGDSPESGNISPISMENGKTIDFCSSSTLGSPDQDCPDGVKRLCLVCADVASGYHYGVSSCEACKAFFKRTIQGNIEYSCPATGECEITKRRRKACQACRFQKCLRVGMLREGVRLDRVRGGRQKYKRTPDNQTTLVQPIVSAPKKPNIDMADKYLATLMALDSQLDKLFVSKDHDYANEEVAFRAAVSDLADRELVITISWAKQVPGFSKLDLPIQMNLLQHSWLEILCLNLVYRSCPYTGEVCFAEDLRVPESKVDAYNIPAELDSLTRKLCTRFTELQVTREEYVLLKSIILCNIDTCGREDHDVAVRNLQDKQQESLASCIKGRHADQYRRMGQLFLVLPFITQLKFLSKQFWFELKNDGRVMMHKLFLEMLETDS